MASLYFSFLPLATVAGHKTLQRRSCNTNAGKNGMAATPTRAKAFEGDPGRAKKYWYPVLRYGKCHPSQVLNRCFRIFFGRTGCKSKSDNS